LVKIFLKDILLDEITLIMFISTVSTDFINIVIIFSNVRLGSCMRCMHLKKMKMNEFFS